MSEPSQHSKQRLPAAKKEIHREGAKTAKFVRPSLRPFLLRILPFFAVQILLFGCTTAKHAATPASLDLASVFPAGNAIPGWEISQKVEKYNHDNLFNLVDGQADSFFAYGFEQVAVQRYQDSAGILMNVEIWQLATPADAFGLFTTGRSGSPAKIGNDGDSDPGRRLAFWQNRYFVNLGSVNPVLDETLQAFGRAIASSLPTGGERPAIVALLPQSGLAERTTIFFHEEMSIQMQVWLGGTNILGLSQKTNGAVCSYQLGDETVRFLLVEYPDSAQADYGLKALQSGNVADLVASEVHDKLLAAVFGKVSTAQAQALLQATLK